MSRHLEVAVLSLALAWAADARADEEAWQTVIKGPITVKNRARPDSVVKEVWAEGEIAAPINDIVAALTDVSRFKDFMPNLKFSKYLGKPEPDGSVFVYTQLKLPVVTSRDYVVQVWFDEVPKRDGTGLFRQHWVSVPNKVPERGGLIRLKVNDGMWHMTPTADGKKVWAVHRFSVDPGGWVPTFAADLGNQQGVVESYKAIEREALKRRDERLAAAAADGGSSGPTAAPAK